MKNTSPPPNSASDGAYRSKESDAAPCPQMRCETSVAITGSRAANGITTASAVRSVSVSEWATPCRSSSAARAESRGRIAVASDTVTTECGTIMMRNVEEYTV